MSELSGPLNRQGRGGSGDSGIGHVKSTCAGKESLCIMDHVSTHIVRPFNNLGTEDVGAKRL